MKDYSQLSPIASKVQSDYHADAKRIEKASQIVLNHEVRQIAGIRYSVKSQSKSAEYLVNIDTLECGCPDSKSKHICKHTLAALILQALPEKKMTLDELIEFATRKIEVPVVSSWGQK